ncbi:heparinase II/III family protein [Coprobacter tertius]|uniref:Heparinase II/III family protein n=1 Tax=Coprobacter tertius TaxID=2944915 RepID=A0ABT1MG18_9BACT|nr:heparinase II/III family protein [Coprobacter tertius]MCP9610974.1 heparinase II/III family protein [Coprobacter tertius]
MQKTRITIYLTLCILFFGCWGIYAQQIDKEAFELIDLNRKGLENVKAFYEEGKYQDAASALLTYYKSRQGIILPDINFNKLKISESEQKMADDALEHKLFAHKGYQPSFFYGKDIDWTYWPVKDNELRWQLHRQKWFIPMGKAYRISGDEKYAKEWVYQYLDWIKKNPLTPEKGAVRKTIAGGDTEYDGDKITDDNVRYAWRPLEVSNRLQDQAAEFLLFNTSKYFTPAFFTHFLVNVHRHAVHIMNNYSKQGNHLLFEAQRILYAGIFFPEFKDASAWRQSAISILNKEIKVQVYNDGMQFELDPHYHLATINIFFKALQMADLNGYRKEFPQEFLDTVEKMITVTYNLSFPDYSNPMFSDAKKNDKSEMIKNYKQWMKVFPQDEAIRYFATEGKSGKLPDYTSKAFPTSGFFVFRNGWDMGSTCMIIKAGPPAFWHCQPDNGTFELFVKGRNFFPDSGSYVYAGDDEVMKWRNWFRQTRVHQTLTLDNRSLEKTDSKCLLWKIGEPTEVLVTENPSYKGLKHRRSVFFVNKEFFVIVDEAFGNAQGKVGIHYEMCEGDVKTDSVMLKAYTRFKDDNNILLQAFSDKNVIMENEEGWVSYAYRQKSERKAFSFNEDKKASDHCIRFITMILPVKDAVKAPSIKAEFNTDFSDAKSLKITVEVGRKKYHLGYDL